MLQLAAEMDFCNNFKQIIQTQIYFWLVQPSLSFHHLSLNDICLVKVPE